MYNIHIINKENQVPDIYHKIDLNRDVIFSFPTDAKCILGFDYSGSINFGLGEEINLSTIQNKINPNSPIRVFKSKLNMKFCCPTGISPIFQKPNASKSILSITPIYKNFISIKIDENEITGTEIITSNTSVIYQNIEVEIMFNKEILVNEYPTMILPSNFKLFDLLLVQTIFSDTLTIGEIYVINNNEFFTKFKESI